MPGTDLLGEFEQLVLLAILKNQPEGYALPIRQTIEAATEREISRGALYRTLDRLDTKGLVAWELEDGGEGRGGHPKKRFSVTADGLAAIQRSRAVFAELTAGVEHLLEPSS